MEFTEAEKIEWIQKASTLHRQVNILYVVDGYEVTVTWDEDPISESFHGETVSEALSKAMSCHDLDALKAYRNHEFKYQIDRQLIACEAVIEDQERSIAASHCMLEALENIENDNGQIPAIARARQ